MQVFNKAVLGTVYRTLQNLHWRCLKHAYMYSHSHFKRFIFHDNVVPILLHVKGLQSVCNWYKLHNFNKASISLGLSSDFAALLTVHRTETINSISWHLYTWDLKCCDRRQTSTIRLAPYGPKTDEPRTYMYNVLVSRNQEVDSLTLAFKIAG